jgi:hypothetical protein
MKNLTHRIALIMLMLVIPLQAMAATSMLLCVGANTSVGTINPSSTTAMAMPMFILNSHCDEMATKNVDGNEQTDSTKIKQMKHQCSQCAACVPMIGITSADLSRSLYTVTFSAYRYF